METFAIVETGSKQLRLEPKQVIDVERLRQDKASKEIVLDKVLMVRKGNSVEVGNPFVKGASVVCEYVAEDKGSKVISFKLRRRKNYRKKIGHRQIFSKLLVKEIQFQE